MCLGGGVVWATCLGGKDTCMPCEIQDAESTVFQVTEAQVTVTRSMGSLVGLLGRLWPEACESCLVRPDSER